MSYFYFQRQFNDKTPYTIMFGPDKCGMDHKVIVMKIILTTNRVIFVKYQCTVLPWSIPPPHPPFSRPSPKFSSVPISPIKNTPLYCHTQLPPQVFRHKSRKTNLNSPVSTAHNYQYSCVMMECQNWSSDTVIDLIVEGRNR